MIPPINNRGDNARVLMAEIHMFISRVGSNVYLAKQALSLGLDRYIRNNSSQGRWVPPTPLRYTMGAIIGAAFEDRGWDLVELRRLMVALGVA
ncbi:uncharacterized protein BP01DRAFT_355479 [Aspergillus saccharolyticus JOP 1030-1]|uniref:RNase III domain-containing protein n=1 Tax=Aspergillus saccharolyticus JOP 1030-1 TaxID=1450539 RepID=A0A319AII8_9EURO|nr:hypothetical protein BP01DRAFT_355479 [Aspergillus saccharolyticus JOP 1030-1]PYH46452.1 hypothetical protein BP01DRAFT_355479 [Aspergillus saccharolyticus JOP 1030-1]